MTSTACADRLDESRPLVLDDEPFFLVHYTALCNASCSHCVVESGPQRKGRMSPDLATQLIEGARAIPRLRLVVFSGGESFIYLDDVLRLCQVARDLGLQTRVISNAYWARTPQVAAAMLERLADGALDQLAISFGEFHREYIPAERVRNVFLGAQRASRAPFVAYSTVNASRVHEDAFVESGGHIWPDSVLRTLASYGFEPEECVPLRAAARRLAGLAGDERSAFKHAMVHERALINWEPLAFAGRAAKRLGDRVRLRPIDEEVGSPCSAAGRQITATTEGRLYPCCSVWTNFPDHTFGTAHAAADVPTLIERMRQDSLVRFIHDRGPGHLIASLRRAGVPLATEYSDICHMCQTLFERFSLDELRQAAAIARDAEEEGAPDISISSTAGHVAKT